MTKKVTNKYWNFKLQKALREIVDRNCEDIDYEGTTVNRSGIVDDIIEFLSDTKKNHFSLLEHIKNE